MRFSENFQWSWNGRGIHAGVVLALLALASMAQPARSGEELRIPLSARFSALEVHEDELGRYYSMAGARSSRERDADGLPVFNYTLRIPADRRVASARLEGAQLRWLSEAQPEAAGQAPPSVQIAGESWWHGERLVHLLYRPLQSMGEGGPYLLWDGGEIVLQLEPDSAELGVIRRERILPEQARRQYAALSAIVQNPESIALPVWSADALSSPKRPSEKPSSKAPSLDDGPYRYLVVTTTQLAGAFERLVDYREEQGLPGIVVTVDEILAVTRRGLDLAETIRYYLQDAYARWGVDYVLLGGDTDLIPTRYLLSTYYPQGGETELPSDFYFAGLDGNWNADGDAIYGEPYRSGSNAGDFCDFVPELAVGRAPVRDASEAATFVDKVIRYENGEGSARLGRALFASEVLFPQDWQPGDAIIRDGAVFSEGIINTLNQWGGGAWESKRLYQNYTGYPGAEEETHAAFTAELNSGNHGLVHHVGHGFYYNMSVGDDNFLVNDAEALTNGTNTFVLMALNCDSAAYDVNCLMERFVRNPNGGSVASIGSSRAAFDNTTNEYQQALYRVIFKGRRQRLGDAILESRLGYVPSTFFDTVDRWTQLVFTMLGDPAMRLWTSAPSAADVLAPGSVVLGTPQIEVEVRNGSGALVDSAAVVLLGGDNQMVAGWTEADGRVRLPLPASNPGVWQLHVNGRDLLPSSRSLNVTEAVDGELFLAGLDLDDSAGNNNGRAEAGELVRLTALLRNGGTSSVGAGTIQLSTDDSWTSVGQADASYSALLPGAQTSATAAFEITLSPSTPDGHLATLDFVMQENGGGSWSDSERLEIGGGVVEILITQVDDSAGNGDGIVDAGEDVALIVGLKNYGSAQVEGLTATLSSSDPAVVVLDGTGSWPALIGSLSSADNAADRFMIRESDTNSPHLYRLDFDSSFGNPWSLVFDLRRPAAPLGLQAGAASTSSILVGWAASPEGDLAGYRIYRRDEGAPDWILMSPDLLKGGAVFLDEGLQPLSRYEYRVTAVDQAGLESPPSNSLVQATPPPEISCFPLPMGREVTGANAVGQLDADGVPDLVVGSELIYVIDGNCEEKLDGDQDAQTYGPIHSVEGSFHQAGVSVGNLDGVGYEEIVATNWETRKIYVYDANGQLWPGWPVQLAQNNWTTPLLGDLDLDGDLEIIVNDVAGWTYAFHHDGSEVADGDGDPARIGPLAPRWVGEWFGRTTPALLDITGDGKPEILFGSKWDDGSDEFFYALKGDGSGNAPGWPLNMGPGAPFLASPAVGDVDRDGSAEIVAPCENDSLYVWNMDGTRMGNYPIYLRSRSRQFDSQAPSPALVDFEGDGFLEIVAVSIDDFDEARIHVFDVQGNERAGWPQLVPGLSESSPLVADMDGDASLDVIFGIGGGADNLPSLLYVFHADGSVFDGFPIRLNSWIRATPTVCDFNLDGRANLLLASWDQLIHVWDLGGTYDPALAPWPTFHGNAQRDGRAVSLSPKSGLASSQSPVSAGPMLRGNHPNPFNPSTVIRFEVPGGGARGTLAVYDAAGRRVRSLWSGAFPAGQQDLRWDGKDESGAEVSSGVYFARLEFEGHKPLTRKMALVR